jgi:hypothetical protein
VITLASNYQDIARWSQHMVHHGNRAFFFLCLILLLLCPPAHAAGPLGQGAPVSSSAAPTNNRSIAASALLAESWGIGSLFSTIGNNRARVVQFCMVVMCLALFIMMRKLDC